MARYDKLKEVLKNAESTEVDMTFAQIEAVHERPLPPSAFKHRAWWSNNPDNNVMTQPWLGAGYQSSDVDMAAQTVTFECVRVPLPVASHGDRVQRVAEMPTTGFVYEGLFVAAAKSLSPRAQEWLDMVSNENGEKEKIIISAIESMASKSLRKSIIDKYSKLIIGSGSDSVSLIIDVRDER